MTSDNHPDTSQSAAPATAPATVLVTGASGFIGLWCVRKLLEAGYRVRGTVRSLSRADSLREVLTGHGVEAAADPERLRFFAADLSADDGWSDAVADCRYVLHVASPLPSSLPRHEDELIIPAREGSLRVLSAAAAAGVERVVLTSSVAAVLYGRDRDGTVYDEHSWSDIDTILPYPKSKTLAERAAWKFIDDHPGDMQLAVINPGLVLGPLMSKSYSTSGEVIRKLLAREMPGCPPLGWAPVDVRDVADAHLAAMTTAEAAGKRFVCAVEHAWIHDIASILAERYRDRGYKVPTRKLPGFLLRVSALFDKTLRLVTPDLGKREDLSNARIKQVLGWQPRALPEMVTAMADSMIEYGVV
jgi:nucleoside-diphosphate-sugar epimerase